MQLDVGGGVFLLQRCFAESIDLHAATPQRIFEARAITIGAHAVSRDTGGACEGGRAQEAAAEAGAFFVGPIDQPDGDGRTSVKLRGDTPKNFEAGEDIEGTVEPAAVGDGIQMTTDQQGFLGLAW